MGWSQHPSLIATRERYIGNCANADLGGVVVKVHEKLYIGGEWVDPAGKGVIDVISPHTEEVVGRVPDATADDVDRAVASARATFDDGEWPRLAPQERIAAVQRFADAYAARMPEMAEIITLEMGSPITFSHLGQSAAAWM